MLLMSALTANLRELLWLRDLRLTYKLQGLMNR